MNSDEMNVFMSAHIDFHSEVKTSKTEELVRLINGQVGRTLYTTFPRMINGTNAGTLFFQELGLYNTPHLKDLKKTILKPFQQLPGGVGEAFTPKKRNNKKYEGTQYTPDQIAEILKAFN